MLSKKRAALYLLVSSLFLLFSFSIFSYSVAASPPYFPLTKESFTNCPQQPTEEGSNQPSCYLNNDFGGPRPSSDYNCRDCRCHKGVDVYVNNKGGKGDVVAVTTGTVVGYISDFYTCDDGYNGKNNVSIDAISIYHPTLGENGRTIIYSEVAKDTVTVSRGDDVKAGQFLGEANACNMLHFEMVEGRHQGYDQWYPSSNPTDGEVSSQNYCRDNAQSTKPSGLMDPTGFLNRLKGNWAKSPSKPGKTDTDITEKLPSDIPEPSVLDNPLNTKTIPGLIGSIADTVLSIVGSLALLAFVVGGVQWLVSGGKPEQIK
ncbi:MAG: hypothetical protein BRC22_01355, partial [Parcubacteria group bacterium QH_9_35_7]